MIDFDRAVIEISGHDAQSFLQGLLTNDINLINSYQADASSSSLCCQYSMLLTPQGRIIYDFFVHRIDSLTFLLDSPAPQIEDVLQKLKRYKMRLDVSISLRPNYYVIRSDKDMTTLDNIAQYLRSMDQKIQSHDNILSGVTESNANVVSILSHSIDPRDTSLGYCAILDTESNSHRPIHETQSSDQLRPSQAYSSSAEKFSFTESESSDQNHQTAKNNDTNIDFLSQYLHTHFALRLPKFNHDFFPEQMFPFEINLNVGLAKAKGCYIGQEVVTRTRTRGIIRKQIFQIALHPNDAQDHAPSSNSNINFKTLSQIYGQGSKIFIADHDKVTQRTLAGKILGHYRDNKALALLKTDVAVQNKDSLISVNEDENHEVRIEIC